MRARLVNSEQRVWRAHKRSSTRPFMISAGILALTIAAGLAVGMSDVYAKGGTAKPPGGGGGAAPPPAGSCPTGTPATSACILPPAGPVLLNFPPGAVGALSGNGANGFAITGLVQNVTVIGVDCSVVLTNQPAGLPTPNGGTVTVNGIVITIPTNTIVQYPANTLSWADAVCGQTTPLLTGATRTTPAIASDGLDGSGAVRPRIYPGVEISVDGNIIAAPTNPTTPLGNPPVITGGGATAAGVGSTHVAALVHISQQSLHSGSGYISAIDYTDGSIYVSTKNSVSATSATRLMLNDPKGRYGRPQGSVDARFSVDDANPTIKAAASGYPMCVPRVAPGSPSALETDPQCPQKNRPNNAPCRNFAATGVNFRIAGADLPTALAPNGFCAGFVMRARTGMPGTFGLAASNLAGALPSMGTYGDPDPREMAPFEVGDFITWQGTLVPGGNTAPPAAALGTTNTDVIWVHTIDANVGIYTQPATLPAYIAIGGNGIGITPQPSTAVAAAGVEATPRIFMEANTTDVASIVDIYLDDKGFSLPGRNPGVIADPAGPIVADVPGSPPNEYFRWITPESMTGTLADQAANAARGVVVPASLIAQATAFGGGIETQFVGPQPGRARIRAIKIPAIDAAVGCPTTGGTRGCAVTQSPTRYIRAVLRSLCAPAATGAVSATGFTAVAKVEAKNLSATGTNTGPFFDINGNRPSLPDAGTGNYQGGVTATPSFVGPPDQSCLQSAQYANGLFTGQYMAPVGEYIFPENTLAGFPVLPNSFWHMGFLIYGENGRDGNALGPQAPTPW